MNIKIFMLWLALCLSGSLMAQVTTPYGHYRNPVIAADFPDPTIIYANGMYYAAGTTSDFTPHYPIYESADLVNWKQIGYIFRELPEWASDSFWAPEFYFRDGTFYVYYTAKRKGDRVSCIGVASTKNIHEGFTDHGIIVEWGNEAIDAYIFDDDDGKSYITWKAYGLDRSRPIEILGAELSADGLSMTGDHFTLTDHQKGWKGSGDEGQVLVKRNGWYYMLYSIGGCCDNRCDYRVVVSRSRSLKEGWEQLPDPILEGGGEWVCSGHGTLVQVPDGRYFYLYHAYHHRDFEYMGRQALLDQLLWNDTTGWPYFSQGKNPSVTAPLPFPGKEQLPISDYNVTFGNIKELSLWQHDLNLTAPVLEVHKGNLEMSQGEGSLTFKGVSPRKGNFTATAGVQLSGAEAGLCYYGNRRNHVSLMADTDSLVIRIMRNGEPEVLYAGPNPAVKKITLKMEAREGRYLRFWWSANGTDWQPLQPAGNPDFDAQFVPQWGVAPRLGLSRSNTTNDKGVFSDFGISYRK